MLRRSSKRPRRGSARLGGVALERPVLLVPGYGNSGPGHWRSLWERALPAARHARPVRAALRVAPLDLACPALPAGVRAFAQAWGARCADLGDAGHVDAASGHGAWPEGERWLAEWLKETTP